MDIVNLVLLVSWFIFINSLIDLELSFINFYSLVYFLWFFKRTKKIPQKKISMFIKRKKVMFKNG